MDILVPDLDEARAGFRQQLARHDQPIPQVRQVGVDAQLPGVAERLDLLCLTCRVFELAVLTVRFLADTCQFEPNLMP